ncbi:hypothetical protein KIF24_06190 [Micromonospora sp. Llam7]|uniref:hypothetical protein n=1 Tax=Micromonospora tarapacensis TaxID=2835305 RepID=UPI001C82A2D3|nr:hypothetical protein [Micromonospora tarapacensis]MBX7265664.1 hypothetical protein [Micromonospora tarapacensis]
MVVGGRAVACGGVEETAGGEGELSVETGTYAPAAVRLYRSCGYEPVSAYRDQVGGFDRVRLVKRLPVAA